MKNQMTKIEIIVLVLLVITGAWLRVALQDIPNFAPVAAMALFAGYFFRRWTWAVSVPLLTMAISDVFIGGYHLPLMAIVYGMLALPVSCRGLLRRYCPLNQCAPRRGSRATTSWSILKLIGCGIVASTLFFLVTNLVHWLIYDMYPLTPAGLAQCYTQALPFFRYTLAGDLFFAATLFSLYTMIHSTVATSERRAIV